MFGTEGLKRQVNRVRGLQVNDYKCVPKDCRPHILHYSGPTSDSVLLEKSLVDSQVLIVPLGLGGFGSVLLRPNLGPRDPVVDTGDLSNRQIGKGVDSLLKLL